MPKLCANALYNTIPNSINSQFSVHTFWLDFSLHSISLDRPDYGWEPVLLGCPFYPACLVKMSGINLKMFNNLWMSRSPGLKWFIPTKRIVVVWKYCRMERKKRRSLPKMDIEKVWIRTFSNSELWCMYCNVFLPGSNTIVPIFWHLFCVVWCLMSH